MVVAEPKLDPAATRRLREFPHETPLMSCVVDPTGRWCFAGGRSRRVYVTDLDSGVTRSLEDHESWVVTATRWSSKGVPVRSPAAELAPPPPPLPAALNMWGLLVKSRGAARAGVLVQS